MKKIRVGINGFGRIGRIAARIILNRKDVELVAINSRADSSSHAYLLKYDSAYGTFQNHDIKTTGEDLLINGKTVRVFKEDEPAAIPWKDAGVDIVIESSGKFRTTEDASGHLSSGAKYVVISAPAKDDTKTLVLGVNHTKFDPKVDKIISNTSCTTNCLATSIKVLHDELSIENGYMTTIHALTDSQNLLDNSHKKEVRLRRASFVNLIPASTGSAKDIGKLFPDLKGKLICKAIRAPIITGSIIDLTVKVKKATDKDIVNKLFYKYSRNSLEGILNVASDELVSSDIIGTIYSSIVDPYLTEVLDGHLVKVYAWYDNEWGYSERLIDMVEYVGKMGL
ncbi:type I glyceraldehyde-3-phosphate dehydrogenase [Candidatus Gottesmanbacteria bacterium]|nr:type I glyceraldehyde-3-phosphate dehydrogenase [Candidatus Gottesmanbacteria bacterium]